MKYSISGSARRSNISRDTFSTKCATFCYVFLHWAVTANGSSTRSSISANNEAVWRVPLLSARHVYERKLEEQRRRRMSTGEEALPMSQLYQGYGTHYVDLWVGSPIPQRQTVIVDTGSSVTAFPCKGCHECGFDDNAEYHTDTYFDPSLSETFQTLSCDMCRVGQCDNRLKECSISMSYAEGSSWSAYEAIDFVYAGGSHTEPITPVGMQKRTEDKESEADELTSKFDIPHRFGCQTSLTGLFRTQLADGIMGMSKEPDTFWDQVHQSGKAKKKQFSLCFSRHDYVDPKGTPAGAMTIGGYDTSLHKSPMVFAKDVSHSQGFYTVRLKGISLRKPSLEVEMVTLPLTESQLNRHGVIVDSGTTDTYFMSSVSEPFMAAWKKMTGLTYSNKPMKFKSKAEMLALPTVVLRLEGASKQYYEKVYGSVPTTTMLAGETFDPVFPYDVLLSIPPSHYMEYDPDADEYTPRLYLQEQSGTVLGANTMQGHDVLFDIENGFIGFAESDCDVVPVSPQGTLTSPKSTVSSKAEITDDADIERSGDEYESVEEEPLLVDDMYEKPPSTNQSDLADAVEISGGDLVPLTEEQAYYDDEVEAEFIEYYDEIPNATSTASESLSSSAMGVDKDENENSTTSSWSGKLISLAVVLGTFTLIVISVIMYKRNQASKALRGGRVAVRSHDLDFYDDDELEGVEIMSSRRGRIL